MSTVPRQRRGVCVLCVGRVRVVPTELLVLEQTLHGRAWLWNAALLCGPCRWHLRQVLFPPPAEETGVIPIDAAARRALGQKRPTGPPRKRLIKEGRGQLADTVQELSS